VFPCLGNHESAPVNSFPPPSLAEGRNASAPSSNQWLLDAVADQWTSWLPSSAIETVRQGGFYTAHVQGSLHVIALNLNYCVYGNWWLLINNTDPAGQLHWLAQTLSSLEASQQQVMLIGHQPPGDSGCNQAFSWALFDIVNRFESTIVAQFYGHTHHDSFRVFFDPPSSPSSSSSPPSTSSSLSPSPRATNIAYVSPSLTPYTDMNPGYRVFELANTLPRMMVTESWTYFVDLEQANQVDPSHPPVWQLEYTATQAYNLTDLSPASWAALTEVSDESRLRCVLCGVIVMCSCCGGV
jgi:sphingomyelin phosphodiesterase